MSLFEGIMDNVRSVQYWMYGATEVKYLSRAGNINSVDVIWSNSRRLRASLDHRTEVWVEIATVHVPRDVVTDIDPEGFIRRGLETFSIENVEDDHGTNTTYATFTLRRELQTGHNTRRRNR